MKKSAYSPHLFPILIFTFLGYLCNLEANRILLSHLALTLFGDFSCAWRSLDLLAQCLLIGSNYSRNIYNKRQMDKSFLWSQRHLLWRSLFIALFIYSLFWIINIHAYRSDLEVLSGYHLIFYVAIFSVIQAFIITFKNIISSLGHPFTVALSSSFTYYVIKLLVIYLAFKFYTPTNTADLTALIASFLMLVLLADIFIFKLLPSHASASTHTKKSKPDQGCYGLNWQKIQQDPAASTLLYSMCSYAPVYIIEIFSSQEQLVGLYCICLILISFIDIILSNISRFVNHKLIRLNLQSPKHLHNLQHYLYAVSLFRIILTLLAYGCYVFFEQPILTYFFIDTSPDPHWIVLMLITVYLRDVSNQRIVFLYSHGKTRYCFWVNLASFLLMVTLGALLIGPHSLTGVLVAGIISQIVRLALLTIVSRQLTRLRFNIIF